MAKERSDVPEAPPRKIETLVEDIYKTLEDGVEVPEEIAVSFGEKMKALIIDRLKPRTEEFRLRLSNLGQPCLRKLWYMANVGELGEKLSGPARLKFLFGDIIEQLVLVLARLSGHSVTHEQHEVSIGPVVGHVDALIDSHLVDIKSASPYSFDKFKSGLKKDNDSFGYLTQLAAYGKALGKSSGHFLPVHKVLGRLHLDTHEFEDDVDYERRVEEVQTILQSNTPPDRGFSDEPDGASGNRKLGVNCSYCEFRETCWPGLRVIPYANGPRFMTKVIREPRLKS